MTREEEIQKYKDSSSNHSCPLCGTEVKMEGRHERDSSNDTHTCPNPECGWSCGEMELWD